MFCLFVGVGFFGGWGGAGRVTVLIFRVVVVSGGGAGSVTVQIFRVVVVSKPGILTEHREIIDVSENIWFWKGYTEDKMAGYVE